MSKENKHQPKEYAQNAHKGHRKVFDVVPPGRAPASATSRPVIMGHKPPVPDDQFVAAKTTTPSDVPGLTDHADEANSAAAEAPSMRASNPAERRTLLNPKHKVEIAPGNTDLDVGSLATAADVQQPVSPETQDDTASPPPSDATEHIGDEDAQMPLSASTSQGASTATHAETTAEDGTSMPIFPVVEQANSAQTSVAHSNAAPSVATVGKQSTADPSSVWEMPADEDAVQNTPHHADEERLTSAPTTTPSGTSGATSTVLQHLNAEEAKTGLAASSQRHSSKTIDELLAETGAPDLGPTNEPPQKTIISHHQPHGSHVARNLLVTLIIVIILAAIIVDLLLDGGFITTKLNIPHTHFF